ncbi:MAG TPA: hypothetical protein ENJ08_16000 [Gammaproteobacteria bacterium]|nr:hypothetical protein [Gammaproteobacteria bacterium]
MKKRQYHLVPDLHSAQQLVEDLLLAQINASSIQALARKGTALGNLPRANPQQTRSIESGLVAGSITGLIIGIIATVLLQIESVPGAIILASMLTGASIGAWAASLASRNTPRLPPETFQAALEEGKILLMIDVPVTRTNEIRQMINERNNYSAHDQRHIMMV